ncbi:MAG: hypothetical protein JWN03_4860 [Nocardia sp.]|uniref:hypothetical protein n=1 Tax=Nocardia sp. TaxID=1821 RepID=UPI00262182F2|nr:hypothetical protein [Nocardia sp.]MCU1644585.1 hypothetical protein [Nocardia sp.]
MSSRTDHPLVYPVVVTIGALAVPLAWAPFGDAEQVAALGAVVLIILGYSAFQLTGATGYLPVGLPKSGGACRDVAVRRVRQQHRLVSRSWLEFTTGGRTRWLPVYFDSSLVTLPQSNAELAGRTVTVAGIRVYPSGRLRSSEPEGRLIDNPVRPDDDAAVTVVKVSRVGRRLLLDAQSAIAGPFAGLLWVYIAGGGLVAFVAATVVAAAAAIWLSAIRGSDPS